MTAKDKKKFPESLQEITMCYHRLSLSSEITTQAELLGSLQIHKKA
jgi:hypothetical protein